MYDGDGQTHSGGLFSVRLWWYARQLRQQVVSRLGGLRFGAEFSLEWFTFQVVDESEFSRRRKVTARSDQ